jgi:hypothetical protein
MNGQQTEEFRYSHWYEDDVVSTDHLLIWRKRNDPADRVKLMGCMGFATLSLFAIVWIFCTSVTIPILIAVAATVGCLFMLRRFDKDRASTKAMIVDRRANTITLETQSTGEFRRIRFQDVRQIIARHGFNGRIVDLEFVCDPLSSVAQGSAEPFSMNPDLFWTRSWKVDVGADEIAAWIGCPLENDHTHD